MKGTSSGILTLCRLRFTADAGVWPSAIVVGAVVPTIFLSVISLQAAVDALPAVAVGLAVLAGMDITLNVMAINGVNDRITGRDVLLRTAGVSRAMIHGVSLAEGVVLGTVSFLPLFLGVALGHIAVPATPFWVLVHVLGLTTFALTGAVIGAAARELPTARLLTNLVTFGLGILCPVLYLPDRVPALLRPILLLLPPALEARALSAAWLGTGSLFAPLALLAAWAIALMAILAALVNRSAAGR